MIFCGHLRGGVIQRSRLPSLMMFGEPCSFLLGDACDDSSDGLEGGSAGNAPKAFFPPVMFTPNENSWHSVGVNNVRPENGATCFYRKCWIIQANVVLMSAAPTGHLWGYLLSRNLGYVWILFCKASIIAAQKLKVADKMIKLIKIIIESNLCQ